MAFLLILDVKVGKKPGKTGIKPLELYKKDIFLLFWIAIYRVEECNFASTIKTLNQL